MRKSAYEHPSQFEMVNNEEKEKEVITSDPSGQKGRKHREMMKSLKIVRKNFPI